MCPHIPALSILLIVMTSQGASGFRHFEMAPDKEVTRKAIDGYIGEDDKAVLVLVPGCNGDGRVFLTESKWIDFARKNHVGIIGVSFYSPENILKEKRGYYDASRGAGHALISLLGKAGMSGRPLLMFGFSGGAHFVSSFVEWHPKDVLTWCAHSAAWWNSIRQQNEAMPPGIVACGGEDIRLGASLSYFKEGRAKGRTLSWVEIPNVGHSRNVGFEGLVREYFKDMLSREKNSPPIWIDLGSGEVIRGKSHSPASNRSWMPSRKVYETWHELMVSNSPPVVTHRVHTRSSRQPRLTLFLQKDEKKTVKGVLSVCLLANKPEDVKWRLLNTSSRNEIGRVVAFARTNSLAVIAWGSSKGLWNPRLNWNQLNRQTMKALDREFDHVANAWDNAMSYFVNTYKLPREGYLLWGFSGAAQYAQRLALRKPGVFRAVHIHVSSSYDLPVPEGRKILWCVTTGENENGYQRSLSFLKEAKRIGYPIIYKAYPGLGHSGCHAAELLGLECFRLALKHPNADWGDLLSESLYWGDAVNQTIWIKDDRDIISPSRRVALPSQTIKRLWGQGL